ncbi:hypothetical protein [Nocardia sp. NPDC050710]|uniref:hypothetical protein n=1 Tax=Nocardia sp. NPDC050710 TaxID=3157220 RepID=UPI0033F1ABCC
MQPTIHDDLRCSECLIGWSRCHDCDAYTPAATAVVDLGDVCESCAEDYSSCDYCGRHAADRFSVDSGDEVCSDCRSEHYRECDDCTVLVLKDETYCSDCAEDHAPTHPDVLDYDEKPTPRFHGNGPLFLGLELEIITTHNDFYDAVDTAIEHLVDLAYLKQDDSIKPCGFELVTHPMSYHYALRHFPWPLLDKLHGLDCKTDTSVGLHIHLSRTGFSGPAHTFRWLKFVYRNQFPVTALARRSSPEWAEFSRQSRARAAAHAKGEREPAAEARRSVAVNANPEHTFELRVFASSLDAQQVQAALGFAQASVEYTRGLRVTDIIHHRGWEWDAFTAWVRARPDYAGLLAEMQDLACAS